MKGSNLSKIVIIILVVVIILIAFFTLFFNKTFTKRLIDNSNNELSQENIKGLSKEYFPENITIDDEGNHEVSGGILKDYYLNVDELYEKIPFKVAVEVATRLENDINFYFNLIDVLDDTGNFDIEKWYETNRKFFIGRFSIFSYSDFEEILNVFKNRPSEIEVIVNNYTTGAMSLDVMLGPGKETIILLDIILDEENTIYYWGVKGGK